MADALDLGSSFERSVGSTPSSCTNLIYLNIFWFNLFIFNFYIYSENNEKSLKIIKNFNVNINYGTQKDAVFNKIDPVEEKKYEVIKIIEKNENILNKIFKFSNLITFKMAKYSFFAILIFFGYKIISNKFWKYINKINKKFKKIKNNI